MSQSSSVGSTLVAAFAPLTLAAIEQEVARRVGPYRSGQQSASSVATTTVASVDAFKSTIDLAGLADLWLLRRGKKADGTVVAGFAATDRQRLIKDYDTSLGALTVDRAWTTAPVATEILEFHHLDPTNELRVSVLAGLRRCFFVDRVHLSLPSAAPERDLTALVAWITEASQVFGLESSVGGSLQAPTSLPWWRALNENGGVTVQTAPDPYPNTLVVTARRPHVSYVNGIDSTTGPTSDDDSLSVDLMYAAAAAHIEAWRLFPSALIGPAQTGQQVSREDAATEFSRQARIHYTPPKRVPRFREAFGLASVQRA